MKLALFKTFEFFVSSSQFVQLLFFNVVGLLYVFNFFLLARHELVIFGNQSVHFSLKAKLPTA